MTATSNDPICTDQLQRGNLVLQGLAKGHGDATGVRVVDVGLLIVTGSHGNLVVATTDNLIVLGRHQDSPRLIGIG